MGYMSMTDREVDEYVKRMRGHMETSELNLDALKDFMKDRSIEEFKPFIIFDTKNNRIELQLEDCSFVERELNPYVTLMYKNHVEKEVLVGVVIKNIDLLECYEHGNG